jgi:hypothetical protein
VKRSKNRSSFGIKARNQPSMSASLEIVAGRSEEDDIAIKGW